MHYYRADKVGFLDQMSELTFPIFCCHTFLRKFPIIQFLLLINFPIFHLGYLLYLKIITLLNRARELLAFIFYYHSLRSALLCRCLFLNLAFLLLIFMIWLG